MPLTLEQKQAVVTEVAGVAATALAAVAAEYKGLDVTGMTALRRSARDAGIYLKVVRNTLARRALQGTRFECMREALQGPLLLAFASEEPGAAARVIRDFAKDHEQLVVRLVALDGRLLDAADLEKVANMPSLEQARATLLGLMQAPLGKFLRVASEPGGKFLRVLDARRAQQTK